MDRPIVNLDELEFREFGHGDRFSARLGAIGTRVGARLLGYNLTVVPPGRRAFPFHNHRVNEEMFLILEGEGELRLGDATYPIRTGDVIACPPGGPATAHQIVNTSTADIRYLAVSTRISPEIAEYPDSGKFGVLGEFASETGAPPKPWRFVGRPDASIDYWDGE